MASTPTRIDAATQTPAATTATGALLVSLAPLPNGALDAMLANLAAAFPSRPVLVANPGGPTSTSDLGSAPNIQLLSYTPAVSSATAWMLTASDYLNAFKLAQDNHASACLLLGAECQSLAPEALRNLAATVTEGSSDLAVARYNLRPREGLVNSAIFYPVTRAVFGASPRFPLAIDLGLSLRMAERLAASAQKFTAANQNDALLWPVAEAATAGYSIAETDIGTRTLPQPATSDLNTLLAQLCGSLFNEVDAKATFWQRSRIVHNSHPFRPTSPDVPADPPDITPMLDAFRLAYTNLHEIWSLVLPPNSLLGLKRLSLAAADNFHLPDSLWARIVYDFILAYRLRTINRGHLLGALTPLYLAWVASHLVLTSHGTPSEKHIQDLAAVFEADKPYLVSRWRWPDRFNP